MEQVIPQRAQQRRRIIRHDTENPEEIAELERVRDQIRRYYINNPQQLERLQLETLDILSLENLHRFIQAMFDPNVMSRENLIQTLVHDHQQNIETLEPLPRHILSAFLIAIQRTGYQNNLLQEIIERHQQPPVEGGRKRRSKQRRINMRRSNRNQI